MNTPDKSTTDPMTQQQHIDFILENAAQWAESKRERLTKAQEKGGSSRVFWAQLGYDNAYNRLKILERALKVAS
jgi:hypothetical protein